jgi:CRISPR-associated protein Cas2
MLLVIVVYDIADDTRRLKLSNFLEGHGRRVQESVFECFIDLEQMKKLHRQVTKRVNVTEDNVRFYWVPVDAVAKTLTIGSPHPEPPPQVYII